MSVKISKLRFLQYGKEASNNSRFKGTIDTSSLVGYVDYVGREDAKEDTKELTYRVNGYIGYTSSHHNEYTISSMGRIETEEDRKNLKNELSNSFSKDGDIFYENVISIASHNEAEKYNLKSPEQWETILSESLPNIFKKKGFDPDNMMWFADVHVNTDHPHIHVVFLEKEHTLDRAKFTLGDLDYMKRQIYTSMVARQDLFEKTKMDYKSVFKKKDVEFKEILMSAEDYLQKDNLNLHDLKEILPKTGRLQYNSYNMKEYKPIINKYIEQIIDESPETKKAIDKWMNTIDLLHKNMNDSSGTDIATIKEQEMNKLYTQTGNMILKNLRNKNLDENSVKIDLQEFDKANNKYSNLNDSEYSYIFALNEMLYERNNVFETDSQYFVRIPRTSGSSYMYIDKKYHGQLTDITSAYIVGKDEKIEIYNEYGVSTGDYMTGEQLKENFEVQKEIRFNKNKDGLDRLEINKEFSKFQNENKEILEQYEKYSIKNYTARSGLSRKYIDQYINAVANEQERMNEENMRIYEREEENTLVL